VNSLEKVPYDLPHRGTRLDIAGLELKTGGKRNPSTNKSAFTLVDLIDRAKTQVSKNLRLRFFDVLNFLK
jgi:hypothetical protein